MLVNSFNFYKIKNIFRTYISLWKLFKASMSQNQKYFYINCYIFGSKLGSLFYSFTVPFTAAILNTNQLENTNLNVLNQIYNSPFLLLLSIIFVSF